MTTAMRLVRRVQLTGGSTYIVSIPKEWANMVGIEKGSQVVLQLEPDGSIRLRPSARKPQVPLEAEVRAGEGVSRGAVIREVLSKYLLGYKSIRVRIEREDVELRKMLREVMVSKLIGAEVMHEDSRELVIQVLVNVEDIPVPDVITKMRDAAQSMMEDPIAFMKGEREDIDLEEVAARDDIVDKLYFYGLRQLYSAVRGFAGLEDIGMSRLEEILPHAMVLKNLERVSDHAAFIARTLSQTPRKSLEWGELAEAAEVVVTFFRRSVDAFLTRDRSAANRLLDVDAEQLREQDRELTNRLLKGYDTSLLVSIRAILGSYRRIVEYSSDILEVVIDLTER
uniref:AbrB/MazE/SpoVT family DNA-binding domain-containing protein n=1 Tax=Thermofilum pendens TaxID=2269 RepID=A0A7C3SKJ1_THEPE